MTVRNGCQWQVGMRRGSGRVSRASVRARQAHARRAARAGGRRGQAGTLHVVLMASVKYIPPCDSEYPGYLRLPPVSHTNGYAEQYPTTPPDRVSFIRGRDVELVAVGAAVGRDSVSSRWRFNTQNVSCESGRALA